MLKPQGRGNQGLVSPDSPCALGGALQSIGRQPEDYHNAYGILLSEWPWTMHVSICPCGRSHRMCTSSEMTILSIIWALNDLHQWTRSQIADWVETFEPKEVEVCQGLPRFSGTTSNG